MSAIEKMKEYAESWIDSGTEYSRGQIIEAMVNKARDLAAEEAKEKPTKCQYWEMGAFAPKCFHPGQENPDGFECPKGTDGECNIVQVKPTAPASLNTTTTNHPCYQCKNMVYSCPIDHDKRCEALDRFYRPTPDKAVEPLAVLADRKGYVAEIGKESGMGEGPDHWGILLKRWIMGEPDHKECHGYSYQEAEDEARQYLEALSDVKGDK